MNRIPMAIPPVPLPFRRRRITGRRLRVAGDSVEVLLSSEETRGQMTVVSMRNAAGAGAPVHFHEDEGELVQVLTGVYEVELDGVRRIAVPGEIVWLPPGVPHAWRVACGPASATVIYTPGGIERLFLELDALAPRAADDPEVLARVMSKHGLNVVAPAATPRRGP
jgi:quercetin dioxygenase-like cupin family protein